MTFGMDAFRDSQHDIQYRRFHSSPFPLDSYNRNIPENRNGYNIDMDKLTATLVKFGIPSDPTWSDSYRKLERVVLSCKNAEQITSAQNYIDLYCQAVKEQKVFWWSDLLSAMKNLLREKSILLSGGIN